MRFVLAVARAGTYVGAARLLRVSESTVIRRVADFERRLSAHLFDRSDKILVPSEAGATIVRRAEKIELEFQEAERISAGVRDPTAGTVRVNAAPIITNHLLVPALPALLDANPYLRVELSADGRDLSRTTWEADVAIRMGRPENHANGFFRQLGSLPYAIYAATGTEADVQWLAYDDRLRHWPHAAWIAEEITREGAASPQLRVNDAETLLTCIRLGLGKSALPKYVGDAHADLICVGEGGKPLLREVWLAAHPQVRSLTRVKIVTDWLARTCRAAEKVNARARSLS